MRFRRNRGYGYRDIRFGMKGEQARKIARTIDYNSRQYREAVNKVLVLLEMFNKMASISRDFDFGLPKMEPQLKALYRMLNGEIEENLSERFEEI